MNLTKSVLWYIYDTLASMFKDLSLYTIHIFSIHFQSWLRTTSISTDSKEFHTPNILQRGSSFVSHDASVRASSLSDRKQSTSWSMRFISTKFLLCVLCVYICSCLFSIQDCCIGSRQKQVDIVGCPELTLYYIIQTLSEIDTNSRAFYVHFISYQGNGPTRCFTWCQCMHFAWGCTYREDIGQKEHIHLYFIICLHITVQCYRKCTFAQFIIYNYIIIRQYSNKRKPLKNKTKIGRAYSPTQPEPLLCRGRKPFIVRL